VQECIAAIAEQSLHALTDLRERHLVHRDVKPQNILLNLRGQVKLSDFGCVAELQDSFGKCGTFVGTVPYMSPERIHGEEYSYASDVWSFGLTIVECALGHFPYPRAQGYWGILQAVLKEPSPSLPADQYSPELLDFVAHCLRKDPNERPSARKLLAHPFVLRRGSASSHFSLKRFLCATFAVTPEPSPQQGASPTQRWGGPDAAAAAADAMAAEVAAAAEEEAGAARGAGGAVGGAAGGGVGGTSGEAVGEASISDDLRTELRAALSANAQLRSELERQQQLLSQVSLTLTPPLRLPSP